VHPFWLYHEENRAKLRLSMGGRAAMAGLRAPCVGHGELVAGRGREGEERRGAGGRLAGYLERRKGPPCGGSRKKGSSNLFPVLYLLPGEEEREERERRKRKRKEKEME
jgi:hypothetical protein